MGAIAKAATAPLLLLAAPAFAVSPAVGEREFPTYGYFDPCPVPLVKKAHYPYCRFDGTSAKASPKKWKTVTLENGNIRVTATPEIGGKIWGAVDKASGHDFIYFNDVVKFRDIAMRGPWCSGGIEFNFGVIGHAPWTASPVDWFVRENGDGSASYFAAGDEYITRAKWQVEVRLQEGADHFETRVDWYNASGLPSPYYHWMNAAFPIGENPSFLFPGSHYSGHGGEIADWPVDPEGRHLDVYRENAFGTAKSCHVLPGDASVYGIWWPELGMGAVHRSEAWEKFGRKIFLWALSREGGIWEDLLTDSNGQYAELQSGRYFLQPGWEAHATPFKHPVLAPGSSERFEESWGVLRRREDLREDDPSPVGRPLAAPEGFDWDGAYGLYVRGSQHFAMGDDLAEVEWLLNASLALAPDFAPALDALAAIEMRRGDYAAVHALCRRALAVSTVDEDANYLDGYAYFAEGD
ncbi:MAG: DUF5107 domain-containing protein, partial [Kiritimatiellae bacterium]|nr:DUF5107 domain-containing protein [Kiritimatiellia bacterium]